MKPSFRSAWGIATNTLKFISLSYVYVSMSTHSNLDLCLHLLISSKKNCRGFKTHSCKLSICPQKLLPKGLVRVLIAMSQNKGHLQSSPNLKADIKLRAGVAFRQSRYHTPVILTLRDRNRGIPASLRPDWSTYQV